MNIVTDTRDTEDNNPFSRSQRLQITQGPTSREDNGCDPVINVHWCQIKRTTTVMGSQNSHSGQSHILMPSSGSLCLFSFVSSAAMVTLCHRLHTPISRLWCWLVSWWRLAHEWGAMMMERTYELPDVSARAHWYFWWERLSILMMKEVLSHNQNYWWKCWTNFVNLADWRLSLKF